MDRHGPGKKATIMRQCLISSGVIGFLLLSSISAIRANHIAPMAPEVRSISLADLDTKQSDRKAFDLSRLPSSVQELSGQRVRIRGYILPSSQRTLSTFVLIPETNGKQLSSLVPLERIPIHFSILIKRPSGQTFDFTVRPVSVQGRLMLTPYWRDGELILLYTIENAVVEPVKPRQGYDSCLSRGC